MKKILFFILFLAGVSFSQTDLSDIPTNKSAGVDSAYAWEFNKIAKVLQDSVVHVDSLSANSKAFIYAANYAAMRALIDLEAGTDFYSMSAANAAFLAISAFGDSLKNQFIVSPEEATPAAGDTILVIVGGVVSKSDVGDLPAGSGGEVDTSGLPVANQFAYFTAADKIGGNTNITISGDSLLVKYLRVAAGGGIFGTGTYAADSIYAYASALVFGLGTETISFNSSDWDISITGAMTGFSFDANGTGNSLSNVDLGNDVTGTLLPANGGTGDTDLDDVVGGNAITATDGANSVIGGNVTVAVTADEIEEAETHWAGMTPDSIVYHFPIFPAFGVSLDSASLVAVDTVGMGYASHSFTVDSCIVTTYGPTPNFTFQIVHGATDLFASAQTKNAANTTKYTTFDDATIIMGSPIYLHFPAVTTKPKTVQVVLCGRWR